MRTNLNAVVYSFVNVEAVLVQIMRQCAQNVGATIPLVLRYDKQDDGDEQQDYRSQDRNDDAHKMLFWFLVDWLWGEDCKMKRTLSIFARLIITVSLRFELLTLMDVVALGLDGLLFVPLKRILQRRVVRGQGTATRHFLGKIAHNRCCK